MNISRKYRAFWPLPVVFALFAILIAGCASSPNPAKAGLTPLEKTMTVTAYCDCKKCTGWKRNWYGKAVHAYGPNKGKRKRVGITASGAKAKPGTIAASPSIPFGTRVEVPGYGRGTVLDRGSAINGDHLDVFFKKHKDALRWGRRTLRVRLWLPPSHPMVAAR